MRPDWGPFAYTEPALSSTWLKVIAVVGDNTRALSGLFCGRLGDEVGGGDKALEGRGLRLIEGE